MDNSEIDLLLENQSLKFEFTLRNLDLEPVFCPTPDDLARENRALRDLLDRVEKYTTSRDRNRLEAEGYHFPPIDPGISPEDAEYHIFRADVMRKSAPFQGMDSWSSAAKQAQRTVAGGLCAQRA